MRPSHLLPLALAAIPGASGFYFCVPLSGGVVRTAHPSSATAGTTTRRPLAAGPRSLARRRGAEGPTMDAGEDFDQLDGVSRWAGSATGGGEGGCVVSAASFPWIVWCQQPLIFRSFSIFRNREVWMDPRKSGRFVGSSSSRFCCWRTGMTR